MTEKIIVVKQGSLPTAKEADEIRSRLERADVTVEPPLVRFGTMDGTHLALDAPTPIWAKVTGSSSPYSFSEGRRTRDDDWADCCLTGTGNAHEVNQVAGLDGTYQWLIPGAAGDWRFEAIRQGPGSCQGILTICLDCRQEAVFSVDAYDQDGKLVAHQTGLAFAPVDHDPIHPDGRRCGGVLFNHLPDGDVTFHVYTNNGRYEGTMTVDVDCSDIHTTHRWRMDLQAKFTMVSIGNCWFNCGDDMDGNPYKITNTIATDAEIVRAYPDSDPSGRCWRWDLKVTTFPCEITVTGGGDGLFTVDNTFTIPDCNLQYTVPYLYVHPKEYRFYAHGCGCTQNFGGSMIGGPIPDATISLSGGVSGTATTDSSGYVILEASAADPTTGGVTITTTHPHFVGLATAASFLCPRAISSLLTPKAIEVCPGALTSQYLCSCCSEGILRVLNATASGFEAELTQKVPILGDYDPTINYGYHGTTVGSGPSYPVYQCGVAQGPNGPTNLYCIGPLGSGSYTVNLQSSGCNLALGWIGKKADPTGPTLPIQDFTPIEPWAWGDEGSQPYQAIYSPAGYSSGVSCNPLMWTGSTDNPIFPGEGIVSE